MVLKKLIAVALVASVPLAVSPAAAAAAAVRPGMVALPSATANVAMLSRSTTRMNKKSGLFGAPVLLLVLGGLAATAAVVAVADSGSSSPN